MTGPRRAVYTALIGGYEELREQPVADDSALPFVCFTDDPDLESKTWDVRLVSPAFAMDPVRSARLLKLSGHAELAEYTETLWIDARVCLTADPSRILDDWLDGADVAMPRHSFRADLVTEFEEILVAGLDESSRLYEQLTHYAATDPDRLEGPVPWTGMLARRHTRDVAQAMHTWLLHVLRYSRRDQLSCLHSLALAGVTPRLVAIDNDRSDVHEWPEGRGRTRRPSIFRVSDTLRPPVARLGELRHQVDQVTSEMLIAVARREERIAELEQELISLREQNAAIRRRLRRLRRQLPQPDD